MKTVIFSLFTFILLLTGHSSYATCSRVATVNYQNILVDAGSGKMGEGLRFYLEKDPISKDLLDKYQKQNEPSPWRTATSSIGSVAILTGLLQTEDNSDVGNKSTLIYGGIALIAINYITATTLKYNNEKILKAAVDQYNTRNTPRIYFSPFKDNNGSSGVGLGIQQEF